ncbi:MAG: hypothetical protein IJF46_08230 [Bacteroidaceae bacterium]|nr:hypothetical protein [Bacteroidaceae bacterium]
MKLHIHPDYEFMRPEIKKIASGDYVPDRIFCNNRNVVSKITLAGRAFVVKKYKRPTIANCIIYTFFRKSKARRAYEYALRLLRLGIDTPFPVAYIEDKRCGFFHTGYLITEYMDYPTLAEMKAESMPVDELYKLGNDLISFTIMLQEKRALPLDYNPSNIFYRYDEQTGHFSFALTDINRMRFGRIPWSRDAMRSFEQFGITTDKLYHFLLGYAIERNVDIDLCMYEFLSFRLMKKFRRFLKGKVKEGFERHKHAEA